MPIAKIQLPDGRIAKFEVPEGTTQEEVLAFAQQNIESFQADQETQQSMPAQDQAPLNITQFRPREEILKELTMAQSTLSRANRDVNLPKIQNLIAELKSLDEFRGGTRAAQELPEIGVGIGISELIPDADASTQALVSSALVSAGDPQEIAQILRNASPDIGISQDEAGNLIAANNRTGVQTIINRPGLSPLDLAQTAGRIAAFTPPGRLTGAVPTIAGAVVTEAGLQGLEAAAGGEFNPEALVTEGVATVAGLGLGKAFRGLTPEQVKKGQAKELLLERLEAKEPSADLLGKRAIGAEIIESPVVGRAKKQGFDERVLRSIETSNPETKKKLKESLDIFKKRGQDIEFAATRRSSDPLGASVFDRYKKLNGLRKSLGKRLNEVAERELKGVRVDTKGISDDFFGSLRDLGVRFRAENGKIIPSFAGMDDVNEAGARKVLDKILPRIKEDMTALQAHKLKKLIDSAVDFDGVPTQDVAIPKALSASLKRMRGALNETVANSSPNYREANKKFAEVIGPLSQMDKIFKNMLNLSGQEAIETGVGTKAARTLMSNNVSRGSMIDVLEQAETALKNNNVKVDDDLIKQAVFVDELERMFGSEATTSFTGSAQRATESGIKAALGDTQGLSTDLIKAGIEKARGINQENAVKALEELLR